MQNLGVLTEDQIIRAEKAIGQCEVKLSGRYIVDCDGVVVDVPKEKIETNLKAILKRKY